MKAEFLGKFVSSIFEKGKSYDFKLLNSHVEVEVVRAKSGNSVSITYTTNEFTDYFKVIDNNEYKSKTRAFETGATRDSDEGKLDFDGFLSPLVLRSFAIYMHKHRTDSNGELRDSDNWKKGIPNDQYMKSMWRHFVAVWEDFNNIKTDDDEVENLNALLFNVMGLLHEKLKDNN